MASTGSLVELAARRSLPFHQHMDPETVEWITAHRPDFPSTVPTKPLSPSSQALLRASAVPAGWYAERTVYDTIHGVRHGMRVAALAALLAEAHGLDSGDTAAVIVAAAIHDCRREHDRADNGHGARAAQWFMDHASTVWRQFGLAIDVRNTVRVASAIHVHERPYGHFDEHDRQRYRRAERLCDLLKAADALDRYRQPKLNWWPEERHVREPYFEQMKPMAFALVVLSETAHLAGTGSAESVLFALTVKGVL